MYKSRSIFVFQMKYYAKYEKYAQILVPEPPQTSNASWIESPNCCVVCEYRSNSSGTNKTHISD